MWGKKAITRIDHGEHLPRESAETSIISGENATEFGSAHPVNAARAWRFDYMFPKLAYDGSNTLAAINGVNIVESLMALGAEDVMVDHPDEIPGVPIPTIYTFFGQFVDHDITHEKGTETRNLSKTDLSPLFFEEARKLKNARSPNLDLDSVYGSVSGTIPPRDPKNTERFRIDPVSEPEGRPPGKGIMNDLPRDRTPENPQTDRVALIGDVRNDENIITAQMHVAFLHAHNALIDRGYSFAKARKKLIQHYQYIVLEDFLPRVADPGIIKKIRTRGPKFFKPSRDDFFTPLEFSAAAYRFGHSKVKQSYDEYNKVLPSADLFELFTFTRFSGALGGEQNDHISGQWIIDWKNFLDTDHEKFFSRPIDTRLSLGLLRLRSEQGASLPEWKQNLAIRNLLRGYLLRLPTGQAVAREMKKEDESILELSPCQIASVVTKQQFDIMDKAKFLENTPLWFYILAEAAYYNKGHHLGPVGSTIVAETLIGMLRYSDHSILSIPGWRPTLGLIPGKFDLEDLLILAGVHDPRASE